MAWRRSRETTDGNCVTPMCLFCNLCVLSVTILVTGALLPYTSDYFTASTAWAGIIFLWIFLGLVVLVSAAALSKKSRAPQRPTAAEAAALAQRVTQESKTPRRTSRRVMKAQEFISDGSGESCMVCRHPVKEGDSILVCPHCHSQAHKNHLLKWLRTKPICPMCRGKLR
jgi:hypothetical protein